MKIQSKLLNNDNFKRGLVSYVLCIHEKHSNLSKCINSIFDQTYPRIELIIVIDNNDKDLENFIKKITKGKKIKYILNQSNLGLAKSLNKAILNSSGEFIARIDSDDICVKDRTNIQVEYLNKNKDIDVLGGSAYVYGDKLNNILNTKGNFIDIKEKLLFKNPIIHPTVMMRKNIFKNIRYDESYRFCQDYKLWIDIRETYKFNNLENKLIYYSVHKKQYSLNRMLYVIKIYFFIFMKYKKIITLLGIIVHFGSIIKKKIK
ncbi:glycosyltransferase [Alphaproteobacteria bacterium]|nr:glycosyltransferase [Alphaproteobacteria bacterium]